MKTNAKYWIETFRGVEEIGDNVRLPGSYYWRIVSKNGQILATSEGYSRRRGRDHIVAALSFYTGLEVRKEPS